MVCTASTGYLPEAVSPESMTQLVPSKTALATSLTSARVGRGLRIMESSICVAVMTGLPAMLVRRIIFFCSMGTSQAGISTPRSPRATISPSLAAIISSRLSTPSRFSILEMMRMCSPPQSRRQARMSSTSLARRTKEAATKSKSCSAAKRRSARSFSVREGRCIGTPGMLMLLLLESGPPLRTRQRMSCASMLSTSSSMSPSSMSTRQPGVSSLCSSE